MAESFLVVKSSLISNREGPILALFPNGVTKDIEMHAIHPLISEWNQQN